jgi:hypothetical protein
MFHIFRWRRQRNNQNTSPSDLTNDPENKKSHSRRHRLRVYHGKQSIERLFHVRRHRSLSDSDKPQVIMNESLTI